MTKRRHSRLAPVLALLLVTVLAAACSSTETASSGESNFPAPSTAATATTDLGPPVTTTARAACSAATLGAAAVATFEAAALIDVVCEPEAATATLTNGPDGELVVLFTLQNGTWALVGSGPIDGDVVAIAPTGFSPTAVPSWQRLRNARLARGQGGPQTPTPSTPPSSTRTNPATNEVEVCIEYSADYITCAPVTTPPDTEPPDPDNPDATPTPPVTSNFCRYNFNDTRCTESGQTFQPRTTP